MAITNCRFSRRNRCDAAMSESGLVSRVSPVQTALRNCARDEGRSFEVGNQVLRQQLARQELVEMSAPAHASAWF